jgi:2-polyprenyl-3-methyl-5-hydroxy-6-metoxy-1,4-benzoquinol methylase
MLTCCCGNNNLYTFNFDYGECKNCGTLVFLGEPPDNQFLDLDDDIAYYGKQYWLNHQRNDLNLPDIFQRSRSDLTERNIHWLKTLLNFRLPHAKILELGCSHAGFLALAKMAGFNVSGVELSPWIVDYAKSTFNVPIFTGPIESLEILPQSYDVIALFDVLEHLPDPLTTITACLKLLKPDGLLLIQTPQFKVGMNYDELKKTNAPFLQMLVPKEHMYLFSEQSVIRMFKKLGAHYIQFETAIFDSYDMFFAVSRAPFKTNDPEQIESALLKTPNGRIALALLDLREREINLLENLKISEADRLARWEQIETLTKLIKATQNL